MFEQQASIATQGSDVELVIHGYEDVDVVWILLARNERSEYHEAGKPASALCDLIHTAQSQRQELASVRTSPKATSDLTQCSVVNAHGQIAASCHFR